MDNGLVEVPVLDLFKGSEAEWTKKFTGRGANISRGVSRWYENMNPEKKEARGIKHSEDMVKYHSNTSPEEREYNGSKISKGHMARSEEAKLETSRRISEGLIRYNNSCSSNSLSTVYYIYELMSQGLYDFSKERDIGKAISKGQMNMSEEAKESWRQAKIEAWAKKNISLVELKRLRDEGLARWLSHSGEWLIKHSKLTSDGMSNMTSTQIKERGESISEGQKAYWDSLTPEQLISKNEVNSQAQLRRWEEASPEQIEYWLSCVGKGNSSLPEALLGLYLDREFSGQWLHNGQQQQGIIVGRKIPDFVSTSGKYIIELFGDYWHPTEEELIKVEEYKSLGWDCLVVWEYEVWLGLDLESRLKALRS